MSKRRLPIPLILLIPLLMLAIVIVAGVYRFSLTDEEIGQKQGWYKSKPDEVMLSLFSYKDGQPWKINLPESHSKATLTHFIGIDENRRAVGDYVNGEERGTVTLNYMQLNVLNFADSSDGMTFVAPYAISNQGSGNFYYIGMFKLIESKKTIKQLDSVLIGDRIQKLTIKADEPFDVSSAIAISYLKHGTGQAMAEKPNVEVTKSLIVHSEGFAQ